MKFFIYLYNKLNRAIIGRLDNSARLGSRSDKPKILDLGSAVGRTEEEILSECPPLKGSQSQINFHGDLAHPQMHAGAILGQQVVKHKKREPVWKDWHDHEFVRKEAARTGWLRGS